LQQVLILIKLLKIKLLKKRRGALSLEAPFAFFNILLLMIKFMLHFHIYIIVICFELYYHVCLFWKKKM